MVDTPTQPPGAPVLNEQIQAEQIRLLFASTAMMTNAQLIGIALFLYVFAGAADKLQLLGWAVYQLITVLARHDLAIKYRQRRGATMDLDHWQRRFAGATWAIALGWGLTPLLFPGTPVLRAFNILVISLFSAGALSSLSVKLPIYRGFLLITAGPITVLCLVAGDELARAMGIASLAGMVYFWHASRQHYQVMRHSLSVVFENQALAAAQSTSARALQSLFDTAPVPLMLVRRSDGSVTRFNSEALTMALAPGANPEGCYELERLFDEDAWRQFARSMRHLGDQSAQSISFTDDSGVDRHFILSSTAVDLEGESMAIVGFQDITEQNHYARELLVAKQQAEQALQNLKLAQDELLRSEKLAALGSLVAGVAHEINTPLGNTLTAATHLADEGQRFRNQLASGGLRRSDLERFLATEHDITALMLSNMERAVALVQSFKQVAVDQTSDDRRQFDLRTYIDEVVLSLGPRLKGQPHQIQVDCPADIAIDGYPGALFQVLSNLVMNALLHAFTADTPGQMSIHVTAPATPDGLITLVFQDNGCGMPPAVRKRVFDPFFTTRRGAGGSGLGLHIVYNLVTVTMAGQIQVHSTPGEGTRFEIRFPPLMPLRGEDAETVSGN